MIRFTIALTKRALLVTNHNKEERRSDREQDHGHTPEETDQLSRSTKKMKRATVRFHNDITDREDIEMAEVELGSPNISKTAPPISDMVGEGRTLSYTDTLQRNNPNLNFETRENPIW